MDALRKHRLVVALAMFAATLGGCALPGAEDGADDDGVDEDVEEVATTSDGLQLRNGCKASIGWLRRRRDWNVESGISIDCATDAARRDLGRVTVNLELLQPGGKWIRAGENASVDVNRLKFRKNVSAPARFGVSHLCVNRTLFAHRVRLSTRQGSVVSERASWCPVRT